MATQAIPEPDEQTAARRAWVGLHAFRRDLLVTIAAFETPPKGVAIKDVLSSEYGEEVRHGRLYPNLDALADADLLDKGTYDDRTNKYELTEWGERVLEAGADRLAEVTA